MSEKKGNDQHQGHEQHPSEHKPGEQQQHPQDPHAPPTHPDGRPQRVQNPAQPLAETEVPEKRPEAKAFLRGGPVPTAYPKLKFHPVHGGVEVKDANEEGGLYPPTDWFDSPELADLARTETEAQAVLFQNMMAKAKVLEDRGLPVVRNSVQADEATRAGQAEPL